MAQFSLDTAKFLIDFCIEAYKDRGVADVSAHGFEITHYFDDEKTDTQAFIAKDEGRIVVAFRGTESKEDIFTDLKIKKLKHPPMRRLIFKSRVHKGFLTAYFAIDNEIRAALSNLLEKAPYVIYFTGHSLGGALAHLAALDVMTKLKLPVSVYSFGSPRVGNRWWRRHYNGKVKNSYRIVNDDDIIPSVPSKTAGYRHVDTYCLIDEEQTLYINPSREERIEKEFEGWASMVDHGLEEHRSAYYKSILDKVTNVLDVGDN